MKTSTKVWMCLAGIALVALGVICIAYPLATIVSLAWVMGFIFFAAGCSSIGAWSKLRSFVPQSGVLLFTGILQVILGLLLAFNPAPLAIALPFIFAFWLIMEGISMAVSSSDFKQIGFSYWWIPCCIGVLAACFGVYALIHPAAAGEALVLIVGIGIIFAGIGYWVKVALINKTEKQLSKVQEKFKKSLKDIVDAEFEEVK
ncbi:MAG: DUF308 domain-containing protein [Paludibacteraceae bacterium]|nr:DUF308 domain-containing protein [Paludibacteraceae bacterium]